MRRRRGWIAALAALIVAMAAGAVALIGTGAAMAAEAERYFAQFDFSTAGPVEIDQDEFDVYNDLYLIANDLDAVAAPLLMCTLAGGFVLLAILAQRYDVRHRARRDIQAEASTAS